MSPTASQLAAHARHISAQARQTVAWWAELRTMKFIAVWQISAAVQYQPHVVGLRVPAAHLEAMCRRHLEARHVTLVAVFH